MYVCVVGTVTLLVVRIVCQSQVTVPLRVEVTGASAYPLSPRLVNLITEHQRQVVDVVVEVIGQVGLDAEAVAVAVVQGECIGLVRS